MSEKPFEKHNFDDTINKQSKFIHKMSYGSPMIILKSAQNIMINLMKWHPHSKIDLNNNFLRKKKENIDICFYYINIQ
jgi:hypothetical protein